MYHYLFIHNSRLRLFNIKIQTVCNIFYSPDFYLASVNHVHAGAVYFTKKFYTVTNYFCESNTRNTCLELRSQRNYVFGKITSRETF